jgi:hypothetical protein
MMMMMKKKKKKKMKMVAVGRDDDDGARLSKGLSPCGVPWRLERSEPPSSSLASLHDWQAW